METWGQVCSGIATVVLLLGSGAGFAALRLGIAQHPVRRFALDHLRRTQVQVAGAKHSERKERARLAWLAGALVGVGTLLMGFVLRGVAGGQRSLGDRAALVALVAGLLTVGHWLLNSVRQGKQLLGWAGLIPVAVVAGISAAGWPLETPKSPLWLICTLVVAGLELWSAGQSVDVLTGDRKDNQGAAVLAFAGLTVNVVALGGVYWRVWGTPGGMSGWASGCVLLLAAWLVGAARLVLRRAPVRLKATLDLLAAVLVIGVGLSIRWVWPFS